METAVNLVQDAAPMLGECALLLGQGIVGLLTASLVREFPMQRVITADRYNGGGGHRWKSASTPRSIQRSMISLGGALLSLPSTPGF